MPNFLSDLSIYNPKAAAAIADAVLECNNEKASMMSGLKTTANDVTLSDEIRLDALTALINLGNLLDIPLPPYFPSTVTYRNTQEFVGVHNDLEGLQGGAPGEYFHLTQAERDGVLNKASISDITWDNLSGNYSDNEPFALLFDNKQEQLVAPALGEFYVKINGTTIIYDNTPTIGNITGIVAGGELDGTYPNPTIQNVAVINKVLTGFNGSASTGTILPTDSILTAFQKLNANINNVVNNPSGVSSVAFSTTAATVFTTSSTNTGAVTLSLGLQNQNANLFLASPNGTAGQPSFRQLVNADLPNSGASAGVYGSASLIPRITVNAKGIITGIETVVNPSGGQVNSISISAPSFLSASSINSVIPATPIITIAFSGQAINQVFAGPASGATGTPLFRSLVVDDIPQLPITKIDGLDAFTGDFLSDSLGASLIYMGNNSNKAVQAMVGGDIEGDYELINNEQTAVFTIKNQAVTYDKFQFIPDSPSATERPILLGRFDLGQGIMQQMTLSDDFTISPTGLIGLESPNPPALVDVGDLLTSTGSNNLTRLSLPSPSDGYLLMPYAAASSPACGLIWGEVGGDITYTVDDTIPSAPFGAFSIGANKVTFNKIQQLPAYTVIGNATGTNPATATALSKEELTTLVNQFTTDITGANLSLSGVVPGFNINGLPSGKSLSDYFLNASGGWSLGGGGSGSGTVGTGVIGQLAIYDGTTSVQGYVFGSALTYLRVNSAGDALEWGSPPTGGISSIGLIMPSAFTVTPATLTANGDFTVTGAGLISQYIRGDGTLGVFPTIGGGGGGSVYYLNGNTSQGSIGGTTMYQLSTAAGTGAAANFTRSTTGAIASFITDVGSPNQTSIPAGIWVFEAYMSEAGGGANHAEVQAVVEKWNGTSITVIATGPVEEITNGPIKDLYTFAVTIPSGTTILTTDRIVIQIQISNANGKTVTLYTENGNVSSVTTTFPNGIASLNGLTAATQFFATPGTTGTAPAFVSSAATHTLNIPLASATSVTAGLISKTDYDSFAAKMSNPMTAEGDIIYGGTVTGGVAAPQRLAKGANGLVLKLVSGLPSWETGGGGDVNSSISTSTQGNFVVFDDASGKLIGESAAASLTLAGLATFNTGVNVGVASSATGSITFAHASTSFTTTIAQPGAASVNTSYFWPTSAGAVGNVLQLGASGQLTWSSAGSGDVTRAGTSQVITGSIIYQPNALIVRDVAQTRIVQLNAASTGGSTGTWTASFQAATGTVPLLEAAQTFSGAQTFQANTTIGGGSYNATLLSFTGTTSNRIQFAAGPVSAPIAGTTAPVGTRITVANSRTAIIADFTIGMASATEMYLGASGEVGSEIAFYNRANKLGAFTANGLSLFRTEISGSGIGQLLINAGASTSTGIGNATSYILFSTSVSAAPGINNSRTTGTRIVLQPNVGGFSGDAAIGHNATENETWLTGLQTPTAEGKVSFYSAPAGSSASRRTGYFAGFGLVFDTIGSLSNGAGAGAISFTQSNWINFGSNGTGVPSSGNVRSTGTKIVLRPNTSTNKADYAIGVNAADYETWITGGASTPVPDQNGGMVGFWVGQFSNFKRTVWITEDALNLAVGTVIVGAGTSQNVFNTVATTVNFAGAATTVTIGATTGTATIRNAILNLSNASGQLQINNTKVVGTRITGYGTPTGGNRGLSFAATTQAEQVLAQLVADLKTHGLIG